MKLALLNLFFCASSTFTADSTKIIWTSDTTYIKAGVECVDPIEIVRKYVKESYIDVDDGSGLIYPGDYDYIRATEYDFNPANINADPWMYRQWLDLC